MNDHILKCPLCGQVRHSFGGLGFHVSVNHARDCESCVCGYRSKSFNDMAWHLQRQKDWSEHLATYAALNAIAGIGQ